MWLPDPIIYRSETIVVVWQFNMVKIRSKAISVRGCQEWLWVTVPSGRKGESAFLHSEKCPELSTWTILPGKSPHHHFLFSPHFRWATLISAQRLLLDLSLRVILEMLRVCSRKALYLLYYFFSPSHYVSLEFFIVKLCHFSAGKIGAVSVGCWIFLCGLVLPPFGEYPPPKFSACRLVPHRKNSATRCIFFLEYLI